MAQHQFQLRKIMVLIQQAICHGAQARMNTSVLNTSIFVWLYDVDLQRITGDIAGLFPVAIDFALAVYGVFVGLECQDQLCGFNRSTHTLFNR